MNEWGHFGSLLPLKTFRSAFLVIKNFFLESITQEVNLSVNVIGFIFGQALIT